MKFSSYTAKCFIVLAVFFISTTHTQHADASEMTPRPLPAAVCFVHVGATNKPMPSFCVSAADSYTESSDPQRVILNVENSSFKEIIKICKEALPANERSGYQITGIDDFFNDVDGKQIANSTLVEVIDLILSDSKVRNVSTPDVVLRVRRGLGYPD